MQSRLQQIHEALNMQKLRNEEMEGDIDLRIRAEKLRLLQQMKEVEEEDSYDGEDDENEESEEDAKD